MGSLEFNPYPDLKPFTASLNGGFARARGGIARVRFLPATHRAAEAFAGHCEQRGLNLERTFTAWREVWRFLRSQRTWRPGCIARCIWCGLFFVRRRQKDESCSTECALGRLVLLASEEGRREAAASRKLDRVVAFERERAACARNLGIKYGGKSKLLHRFLEPVLAKRIPGRFSFPGSVRDPHAFKVVWDFLFQDPKVHEVRDRVATCKQCGGLYLRSDRRMRFCGRACQVRRYNAARVTTREVQGGKSQRGRARRSPRPASASAVGAAAGSGGLGF